MATIQEREAAAAVKRADHHTAVLGILAAARVRGIDLSTYQVANTDDAGSPKYYGFTDRKGYWYIQKEASNVFTYARGNSGYAAAWTGRAALTYAAFSEVF